MVPSGVDNMTLTETMRNNIYCLCCNRERKSRDLVLALEFTGEYGCFYFCVTNRIIFGF